MSKLSAAAVLDRLLAVYGVKNDNQLSDLLAIKRSTIGNWRSRDSVPYSLCVSASVERGVSLDWLITGEGSMLRSGTALDTAELTATYSSREQAILALFRDLGEEDQREIQHAAEEKKRLKRLEQRLSELEAVVADVKKMA
ncbi:helix-turn-helix transcriptional regulator [Halopseudomonas bauzanensis]|uniref:helix-turn-helix transcriptional regulator n=1 Tax=Halopseudomonas bauzanensis TaxID=653930 RepID=UPI0035262835